MCQFFSFTKWETENDIFVFEMKESKEGKILYISPLYLCEI